MAARARSTLKALRIMGNSVHGLDFANWRLVFHAVILPVLVYGLAIWSHHLPKSLIHTLQVAQNEAVRCIGGVFRTTPTDPLHRLLSIPPIQFTIAKLRHQAQLRLTNLPPEHKLRTLTSFDPTRIHPDFISVPTPLTSLTPTSFPPFFRPANRIWSHLQFSSFLTRPKCDKLSAAMRSKASEPTINHTAVFIYPIPHPDHFVTGFLVAQDDNIISHGFSADHNQLASAARATVLGAQALSAFPSATPFSSFHPAPSTSPSSPFINTHTYHLLRSLRIL